MIKAIIFDLKGVFIVSRRLSERFEEQYGVPRAIFKPAFIEAANKARSKSATVVYSYLLPQLKQWKINITFEEFSNFWFSDEKPAPEMVHIAKQLKAQGIKIFVLSNCFKERITFHKEMFTFFDTLFDASYYSWQTGFIKPDIHAFQQVLSDHNLKADECIFFDDKEENIVAAGNLGIQAYLFNGAEDVRWRLNENNLTIA